MNSSPYAIVALSTLTYSTLFKLLERRQGNEISSAELRLLVKSISAVHSTATTVLALIALNQSWTISSTKELPSSSSTTTPVASGQRRSDALLDDSNNPVIAAKNKLADAITAWELGYLIYDTGALLLVASHRHSRDHPRNDSVAAAVVRLCKTSPVFIAHHAALIAALSYLQTYIATGREKGLWVITAFLCMNASNPLLHLRWWNYKKTGRHSQTIDAALAAVFAAARFGTLYWVIKKYGLYHGLSSFEAMKKQRRQCQVGTGLLTSMNFVWWIALLMQMARRAGAKQVKSGQMKAD